MRITEEWIAAQAPNPAAVNNGKKLSQSGKFSGHCKTQDDTLFWADCAGSGKTPYHTSIDLSQESNPVCRCSCPSRQFPCKHAVGLMFELMDGRDFAVTEIPEELAQKRAKQAERAAKKEQKAQAPKDETKPKRSNQAAKSKKLQKQLEGIQMARQMVSDLMGQGLGTLAGTSAKRYEDLAKDLGSCYLTGAQAEFTRLAAEMRKMQKDGGSASTHEALRILVRLNSLLQKSDAFLREKLETKNFDKEDNALYEALGGIWKLDELEAIGAMKQDAEIVQLSFDVFADEAKKEFVDRSYWMDLADGKLYQRLNYRPYSALKYVKAEDSTFSKLSVPKLLCYPGSGNPRIRWDGCTMDPMDRETVERLLSHVQTDYAQTVKQMKNEIKNTMAEKYLGVLVDCAHVGTVGDRLVLENRAGERLEVRDRRADGEDHATAQQLRYLPSRIWRQCRAVFGLMYCDPADLRICIHPYSLVTEDAILRLQY